jgi:hypothetical protein
MTYESSIRSYPDNNFYQLDIVGYTGMLHHQFHKEPDRFNALLKIEVEPGITVEDHLISSWIIFNTMEAYKDKKDNGVVKHLGFRFLPIKGETKLCSILYLEKFLTSKWTGKSSLNKEFAKKIKNSIGFPIGLDITLYICDKFEIKDYVLTSKNGLNFNENSLSLDYWSLNMLVEKGFYQYKELLDLYISNSLFAQTINDKPYIKTTTIH